MKNKEIYWITYWSEQQLSDISTVGNNVQRIRDIFEWLMTKWEDNYSLVQLEEIIGTDYEETDKNICFFRNSVYIIINKI